MDKCWLDKCHGDSWNMFSMFPGNYSLSFIKIKSVTAEILLTLSLCGGWGGGAESFYCQTQPFVEVRLRFSQYLCSFLPSFWYLCFYWRYWKLQDILIYQQSLFGLRKKRYYRTLENQIWCDTEFQMYFRQKCEIIFLQLALINKQLKIQRKIL